MDMPLEPQAFPVAIADGFIQPGETNIIMQCHDRVFKNVDIRDQSDELLFTVETKGVASWSWRRIVKDATGTPLFHFRKLFNHGVDRCWIVEDLNGREMCSLRHVSFFTARQAVDVVVRNHDVDNDGKESIVQVRPKDQAGVTVLVNIQDATVAEIQMTEINKSRKLDRSVWKARIAGGVDLALIVAIMLCRAEISHVSEK